MTKPIFVMLVGLPASGKTTYAKTLKENDGYEHFSSDELRLSLGFGPGEGSGAVFQKMLEGSKAALKEGKSVIYDATNLSRKRRIHCLETLKSIICTKKCIVFAEPYELCLERNSKRDNFARVPNARMKDMLMTFQTPMKYEGFDEIEVIRTGEAYDPETYIERSKGFSQDNPHHSLDLYEHMAATERYILSSYQGNNKELLAKAARYHDIGKLVTKAFIDAKGNPSTEAHFYRHEKAGAYMFLSSDHHLSDEDALYVSALINWHMRLYQGMSERKIEREKQMVGEEFYKAINALHAADHSAH